MQTIKCVVVGDGDVGKTLLLTIYTKNKFPSEYVPTVFDNYPVTVMIGGEPYTLGVFDTANQEDYDRFRPLSYPQTDIFLVCFNIVKPATFKSVIHKWLPEIRRHCPNTPIILVGTYANLRNDNKTLEELQKQNEKSISFEEAKKLAQNMKVEKYLECELSSSSQLGIKEIFEEALNIAVNRIKIF